MKFLFYIKHTLQFHSNIQIIATIMNESRKINLTEQSKYIEEKQTRNNYDIYLFIGGGTNFTEESFLERISSNILH